MVYGLMCKCHPERGIRYVGLSTKGLKYRLRRHIIESLGWYDNMPVHFWMRKHGVYNIEGVILETAETVDDLNSLEIIWIRRLRSTSGKELLNATSGGGGKAGWKASEEQRRRMSESQKAYYSQPGMIGTFTGRSHTEESKKMLRDKALGRKLSAETRAKISKSSLGRSSNENHGRTKLSNDTVSDVKLFLNLGASVREVANSFGIPRGTVHHIYANQTWKTVK